MQENHRGFLQRVTPKKKLQLLKAQLNQIQNYRDKTDFEQHWKQQRTNELIKEINDHASLVVDNRV